MDAAANRCIGPASAEPATSHFYTFTTAPSVLHPPPLLLTIKEPKPSNVKVNIEIKLKKTGRKCYPGKESII